MRAPNIIAVLAIIIGGTAPSLAQSNSQGAVELSNGTKVPQNPSLPKLNLTNMQREQIRIDHQTHQLAEINGRFPA